MAPAIPPSARHVHNILYMNLRHLLLSIFIASSFTASADSLGLIEADRVYQTYGRQEKSGDFAEYNGMICYYTPDGANDMTMLIEPIGVPDETIRLSIDPDGWQAKDSDEGKAYVYNAPDGSFDIVVMAVDDEDALMSVSRKKKPTISYLFSRKPLQQ